LYHTRVDVKENRTTFALFTTEIPRICLINKRNKYKRTIELEN